MTALLSITLGTTTLARAGSNVAMWVVWLAGILVLLGIIALLIATVRRRSGG